MLLTMQYNARSRKRKHLKNHTKKEEPFACWTCQLDNANQVLQEKWMVNGKRQFDMPIVPWTLAKCF